LPAYLPRAPGAAQSWLENQLANLEVRPTEPPAGLWLRLCRAVLHSLSFFARREDSGAFGGASVHACEPASLPAYLPRAPGAAQSWLENQLANLEVRPTEPPAGLWLRLCCAAGQTIVFRRLPFRRPQKTMACATGLHNTHYLRRTTLVAGVGR